MQLLFSIFIILPLYVYASYDYQIAKTSLFLSGAAYCGKDAYQSMALAGPASGFDVSTIIYDSATDLQGYVGVLDKSIYVAFRGSSSIQNWIDDAEVLKTDYISYPTCKCKVHIGFYKSSENTKNQTINAVNNLVKKYGSSSIYVTGHSYGAAVAQLIGMELYKSGYHNVQVYNFGQPRIGDSSYASFVSTTLGGKLFRFVHNRDIVPHVPEVNYHHSCTEVFENVNGDLKTCSLCEDPSCSQQYSLVQTNADDHEYYLGYQVDCDECTQ